MSRVFGGAVSKNSYSGKLKIADSMPGKSPVAEKKESKKTVRLFAAASFLNDFGSDMIYPIWPLFVTTVLGANTIVLGLIDGLGDALVSISQAASGYLSDRIRKRKVFVWLGYIFGALSRVGYSISTVWPAIIPFKILDRAGKMRGAPRDAIIADLSTKENRGGNFGLLRAMDNLGAVFGIIFTILLIGFLGYRKLFLLAAIPSIIAAALIFFFIKERKVEDVRLYKGFKINDLDANFRLFLLLSSFFALGSFSYSFLLLFASKLGFAVVTLPMLYLIFTAFAAGFSFFFGNLSDRLGRKAVMLMAFALWGVVCSIFIFVNSFVAIIIAFVVYGLHRAAIDTVQRAFVAELSPKEYRASSLGSFQMVIGLCSLPASLAAGILWYKVSPATPFIFSLGLTALAMVLLPFVKEKRSEAAA